MRKARLVSFTNYFFTLLLPLYCPLTYPGAHTLLSISSMPALHELGKFTVCHAASQWEVVAPHLVVESCGVCKFGSGHLDEASRVVVEGHPALLRPVGLGSVTFNNGSSLTGVR